MSDDIPDPDINELVRVRVGDVEKNMGRALAELSDGVEILEDESVHTEDGRLREETRPGGREMKPKTTVAKKAAAKKAAAKKTASSEPPVDPPTEDESADDSKEQDQ